MKPSIKILFCITFVVVLFAGCKKEKSTATSSQYVSLADFFSQNKVVSQSFVVNAVSGGTITGAKSTVVTFPPNAFINANGTTVTGNVDLKLKEVFSKSDMIYANVFPVAYSGDLLNSAGEYFLSASQNGNQVNVKKGHFFEMRLPAQAADPNMQFFMRVDSAGANWQLPDTAIVQVDSQFVMSPLGGFTFTTSPDSAYNISSDSLGWGNADVFMNPTYVPCSFTVSGASNISSTNTKAYCIYDGKNTVWPSGESGYGTISNNIITDQHIANIPIHFLVISVIDNTLYAGSTAVTPALNGSYTITVAPITKESLDVLIRSFH